MLALVMALMVAVNAVAQEARIVKLVGTGSAVVEVDGRVTPAREAMVLPLNAEIRTTGQEVYVEVATGIVATVKANSIVRLDTLSSAGSVLELKQGTLVSQIDKKRNAGKSYQVKTPRGVAAARGTAFTISLAHDGLAVAATADAITFTTPAGVSFTVQAGMISRADPGQPPGAPMPLATAAASDPEVGTLVRDAVQVLATVVENNLGSISADSAVNLMAQVLAVAVMAVPTEATTFTAQAVTAVTSSTSATGASADSAALAAGAVTAAAVQSAPAQAAAIAGAAAQAAPAQAGVITAAAQSTAPAGAASAIVSEVASATGQTTSAVQASADASATQAANAVSVSRDAISGITSGSASQATPPETVTPSPEAGDTGLPQTPSVPVVDPTVSPSS
ncbi:FecR domain-containing protein [Opitutus sp. ER46]|uniref:FecR domain-containing protein n=1 Tax=Opitutus sp. ER46 TaxID=2161864 RepID=UPI00130495A2|nr:FecR domain-containing protein [Opitutus sp. ER46]